MENYKIIIVDENAILRSAVRIMISRMPEMQVIDETNKGSNLLNKLAETSCDLVWMDTALPDMDGYEILSQIKKVYPIVKILIYTSSHEKEHIERLLDTGVQGILLKDDYFSVIPIAIQAIREGGTYYSEDLIY
ncbi:MAG: response regulator transcription factor [Leptospiraceae bacterium]|jgi:DNA-binding NarL/FixJ family response regulator|nr:response regulator transcription factor [Leptospiraceae bacterium]MBL0263267.1 response regulator transcription factor [Leptospiraceae bacterium]MBP9165073.1 response regulator transcription factor [Leptospiraceae bacterium]